MRKELFLTVILFSIVSVMSAQDKAKSSWWSWGSKAEEVQSEPTKPTKESIKEQKKAAKESAKKAKSTPAVIEAQPEKSSWWSWGSKTEEVQPEPTKPTKESIKEQKKAAKESAKKAKSTPAVIEAQPEKSSWWSWGSKAEEVPSAKDQRSSNEISPKVDKASQKTTVDHAEKTEVVSKDASHLLEYTGKALKGSGVALLGANESKGIIKEFSKDIDSTISKASSAMKWLGMTGVGTAVAIEIFRAENVKEKIGTAANFAGDKIGYFAGAAATESIMGALAIGGATCCSTVITPLIIGGAAAYGTGKGFKMVSEHIYEKVTTDEEK